MAYKKGHKKIANSGMQKGQKTKKTLAWEAIGEYLINEGTERYMKYLQGLSDKSYAIEYKAILEFFKPKLNRTNLSTEGTIHISFDKEDKDA